MLKNNIYPEMLSGISLIPQHHILLHDKDKNYDRLLSNYLPLIHYLPCTSFNFDTNVDTDIS